MSSQKTKRRQTIQPTLNRKLLPTSLLNQISITESNSRKSFDSKLDDVSQQNDTITVQTTKKPSAQSRQNFKGLFPLQKKNSNVQQPAPDKQQGVLYGGDNTTSSVYDKYKQNFAKLLLQGLTGDGNKKTSNEEQGNEEQRGAGSNKLTPMPQLQKKGNTNNVNKDVFAKAERSAVVMRRMEYNAKLANRKTVKKPTNKGPQLSKVRFLQKMMRGFLIRKKIINKAKYIRKMCAAIQLKFLSKHFAFFIKQTRLAKKKQTQTKKPIKNISSPIIEESPSPSVKKETLLPLKEGVQPFLNIEKMFDNTSCQTSFIIEREETPKEKYFDLISGGTSKTQNTRFNGIKTFPRLKIELGNNEKLLKKMYKRLNKHRIDEIQIDTKQKLQINLNTINDNAVQSVVQKLLDLRLDTTASPRNSFKVTETQIASPNNEVSSFVAQGSSNIDNRSKALAYVRSLIKLKVKYSKPMFITKRVYSNYQRKMRERRNMKIKLFIIVLSHLSTKQVRKYVLSFIHKKCNLTRNKSAFSVFSIEDEVDDCDEENIQTMKKNATIDMNPLRHRKTCCSTLSKECSNDNYVDDEIDVEYNYW